MQLLITPLLEHPADNGRALEPFGLAVTIKNRDLTGRELEADFRDLFSSHLGHQDYADWSCFAPVVGDQPVDELSLVLRDAGSRLGLEHSLNGLGHGGCARCEGQESEEGNAAVINEVRRLREADLGPEFVQHLGCLFCSWSEVGKIWPDTPEVIWTKLSSSHLSAGGRLDREAALDRYWSGARGPLAEHGSGNSHGGGKLGLGSMLAFEVVG